MQRTLRSRCIALRMDLIPALRVLTLAVLATGCATAPVRQAAVEPSPYSRQVEIRRTEHGVPHITAETMTAAGFGLAWVQLEDHGDGIIRGMEAARGRLSLIEGSRRVEGDARARRTHARAAGTIDLLDADTRAVYNGFAEGMNHYIRVHAGALPEWARPDFTGVDVLARDIGSANELAMARFRQLLLDDTTDLRLLVSDDAGGWQRSPGGSAPARGRSRPAQPADTAYEASPFEGTAHDDVGSNAWALAPSRTASGRAILLRNPHLAWTAGYYEAHLRVPGRLDFYGDFRIGGPFTVIGGFNENLGFATTNNASRGHEFYALRVDPERPGHVLLDGRSHALRFDTVMVEYRTEGATATAAREFVESPIGPVLHRTRDLVYVMRQAANGEYRAGEQWLRMMTARSLEEYLEAMRMQARTTSNFTYADRAGNIHYVWVSTAPLLPHPSGGDTLAVLATRSDQVWQRIAPFDSLPQLLNPPGGYIHNENDSPHFTNMHAVMPDSFPFHVEPPRLRLRSQLGVQLVHNDSVFSLEQVVERKHSPRMLLADRVKPDLLAAVRARSADGSAAATATNSSSPSIAAEAGEAGEVAEAAVAAAADLLAAWDNTAAAESRGAVLFETWWQRYRTLRGDAPLHAVEWDAAAPLTTPHGLADAARAAEAFAWAVAETERRFGAWDVAWGEVHRVRRGDVDVPVAGCGGQLGCFRVLTFAEQSDGRRAVNGGDGWVLAVEFGDTPRAYSVLAYGQSPDPGSPFHADQAAMFAEGRMKTVRFTDAQIEAGVIRRYRPGLVED